MYFQKVATSTQVRKHIEDSMRIDATVQSFGQRFPVSMKTQVVPDKGYISDNRIPKFGTSGHEELILSEHPKGTLIEYTYHVAIHKRWLRLIERPLIGWFFMQYWERLSYLN